MDKITQSARSANMRAIRSKNTKGEIAVRQMLHRAGFRYRLHVKHLPGKPDLVFAGRRKVIFVHGCFWHQHPDPSCPDARLPKSNSEYWSPKLQKNQDRDAQSVRQLEADEWQVLLVWECETKHPDALLPKLVSFLNGDAEGYAAASVPPAGSR